MPTATNTVAKRAFDALDNIVRLLDRIRYATERVADFYDDQAHNAYAEGASEAGPITIGQGGITQTGWNSPFVLDANPGRGGSYFTNTTAAGGPSITLGLGHTTPSPGAGIVLAPGQSWNGLIGHKIWRGAVSARANAAGACTLAYAEIA